MLLNADLVLDAARGVADRLRGEEPGGEPGALVDRAFLLALGRLPDAAERRRGVAFLAAAAGEAGSEGLVDFCHAVLNLNEFVFVD